MQSTLRDPSRDWQRERGSSCLQTMQSSIPSARDGWSETLAAYRFLGNDEIEWRDLMQPHWERTAQPDRFLGQSEPVCFVPSRQRGAGRSRHNVPGSDLALRLRARQTDGCCWLGRACARLARPGLPAGSARVTAAAAGH